jgi:hypothetical protein
MSIFFPKRITRDVIGSLPYSLNSLLDIWNPILQESENPLPQGRNEKIERLNRVRKSRSDVQQALRRVMDMRTTYALDVDRLTVFIFSGNFSEMRE